MTGLGGGIAAARILQAERAQEKRKDPLATYEGLLDAELLRKIRTAIKKAGITEPALLVQSSKWGDSHNTLHAMIHGITYREEKHLPSAQIQNEARRLVELGYEPETQAMVVEVRAYQQEYGVASQNELIWTFLVNLIPPRDI